MKEIGEIAASAGILDSELEPYGRYKAKVDLAILDRLVDRPDGHYIMVTAITPTPRGEGKTATNISLALGIARHGKKVINTLRQPSMGPVFGVKGGATGGGPLASARAPAARQRAEASQQRSAEPTAKPSEAVAPAGYARRRTHNQRTALKMGMLASVATWITFGFWFSVWIHK